MFALMSASSCIFSLGVFFKWVGLRDKRLLLSSQVRVVFSQRLFIGIYSCPLLFHFLCLELTLPLYWGYCTDTDPSVLLSVVISILKNPIFFQDLSNVWREVHLLQYLPPVLQIKENELYREHRNHKKTHFCTIMITKKISYCCAFNLLLAQNTFLSTVTFIQEAFKREFKDYSRISHNFPTFKDFSRPVWTMVKNELLWALRYANASLRCRCSAQYQNDNCRKAIFPNEMLSVHCALSFRSYDFVSSIGR